VASWPPVSDRALIGKSITRIDGPAKTQGTAKYAYDINRPGMLFGRLLGSPHPHARIRSIDLSAAKKVSGVRAALALVDPASEDASKVRYQGEEIAAVAAVTEEAAEDAIRLIKVDYEVLPHLATVEQAMRPEAPAVFPKGNVSQVSERVEGAVDEALAKASHIVEGVYSTQVQTHTSLETHGGVCEWDGQTDCVGVDAGGARRP
jgi:xanthine dehydrogenase YagR molybdenum-binding subunit